MFRKLRGKIVEVYGTQEAFAEAMGTTKTTINVKLNGKVDWTSSEIVKACKLLNINLANAWEYFFTYEV